MAKKIKIQTQKNKLSVSQFIGKIEDDLLRWESLHRRKKWVHESDLTKVSPSQALKNQLGE